MKKLLLILLLGFTFSCSSDEPEICCTVIDASIDILLTDEQGRNLLEAENELSVLAYNNVDGEWVVSRNRPEIIPRENGNYLRVFANIENPEEEISELKLKFSYEDFDIITTQIKRNNRNIHVTRVWYNDELKWEQESRTERIIEVQKD